LPPRLKYLLQIFAQRLLYAQQGATRNIDCRSAVMRFGHVRLGVGKAMH
jgi:hypothetical protein